MATLSIDIPDDLARPLSDAFGDDLGRAALERFALEGYQSGKLSRIQVQRLLGFDNRWEVEEWLGSRGAVMQYTEADLELDRKNLERVLGPGQ